MIIDYEVFKKALGKDVKIVTDGIGNVSIDYVIKVNDGRRGLSINLGGYTDMEPFMWDISTKWRVKGKTGKTLYGQPWDVITTKHEYVETEYGGGQYDIKTKKYLADDEYLKLLLEAKKKIDTLLPGLTVESKIIFDDIMCNTFYYKVEKEYSTKKWVGHLTYKGTQFKTKPRKTFFEAKEELDEILKQQER